MRGGDLTLTVPDDRLRLHTVRTPQRRQRHHHREQRGLHDIHPLQRFRISKHVPQRPVHIRRQRLSTRLHRRPEHRRRLSQLSPHAQPLRALAGEHERHLARRSGDARRHPRRLDAPGDRRGSLDDRGETGEQSVTVLADDDRAAVEGRPRHGERRGDVARVEVGVRREVGAQPVGSRAQRLVVLGRDEQRHHGRVRFGALVGGFGGGCLLDDGVRVGAAEPERRHAEPARPVGVRPVVHLGEERDVTGRPVDFRRGLGDVQGLGQHAVPHRHDHLDDARDPGRALRVPDVGLDRAEPQGLALAVLSVGGEQRLGLDGVAELRTRAVGLDGVHVGRPESGAREGLADDPLLRGAVGGGEAVGRAVLVDGGSPDDREHLVPVALGVGEPFQDDRADAFAPAGAVGVRRERPAPAVGGQAPLAAELDERARRRHHRHAARERHRAVAGAQRLHRHVQRDERGGAGGVDRDRGSFEPEGVGDAPGDDTGRIARADEPFDGLVAVREKQGVVLHVRAGEDADVAPPHRARVDPGALERLP